MANSRLVTAVILTMLCFNFSNSAWAEYDSNLSALKLKSLIHKNVNDTTKRLCLLQFSDTSALRALTPFATVSQMCQCIIAETSFLVSDDLAERLLTAQINQSKKKHHENYPLDEAIIEYSSKYKTAGQNCVEEFIRRSR